MFRDFILVSIGLSVGVALTGWSLYMIVRYYRSAPEDRQPIRAYFRISWLFLLIGLADLGKVGRDMVQLIKLALGEPADPGDL